MTEKVNYTTEQEDTLRALYAELGTAGIETIVARYNELYPDSNKNVRSIRGKLMTFKNEDGTMLYVPAEKAPKALKDTGPSKKELLTKLEGMISANYDVHKAFGGATKDAIQTVIALAEAIKTAEAA